MDARHLIEGHAVPQAHQTYLLTGHIIEKIGHRGLAAGYKDTVRRHFLIKMGFSGTPGAQLTVVEIVFHQRHHAANVHSLLIFLASLRMKIVRTIQVNILCSCL